MLFLEWFIVVMLAGDEFGVLTKSSYTSYESCERHKQAVLQAAVELGDTKTKAYCVVREREVV